MELLRDLRINVDVPDSVRINEPVEIKIILDTTRLNKEKMMREGLSLDALPINISLKVYSDLRIKLAKKVDWRIFKDGRRFEKREDLAIVESKLKVPLGSTLTVPLKFNLPEAFPWIYVKFPKSDVRTVNNIGVLEIRNGMQIDADIDGISLNDYFDNVIEFSPTELYSEDKALDFLDKLISNYFNEVKLDKANKRVYAEKELMDGTVIEISSNARFVALMNNLLNVIKLNKVPLFTHVFNLKVNEFPSNMPKLYSLEGRYVYRVEIRPKYGGDVLRSEITLSRLTIILILGSSIDEAKRKIRRRKADLFVLLSPDKNSVDVKWELNTYKSRVMKFIKPIKGKYLFYGLPQPFIYSDVDFDIIGYYALILNEPKVKGGKTEIPFVVTVK